MVFSGERLNEIKKIQATATTKKKMWTVWSACNNNSTSNNLVVSCPDIIYIVKQLK